jgi:hypothetical protein
MRRRGRLWAAWDATCLPGLATGSPAKLNGGLKCLPIVGLLPALQLTEEWANSLLPGGGVAGVRERLRENQQAEREAAQRERIADAFTSAGGRQACACAGWRAGKRPVDRLQKGTAHR